MPPKAKSRGRFLSSRGQNTTDRLHPCLIPPLGQRRGQADRAALCRLVLGQGLSVASLFGLYAVWFGVGHTINIRYRRRKVNS